MHNLENFFKKLDIPFTTKNKKDLHVLMKEFSHEENCPEIWKYIKPFVKGEEPDTELIRFIKRHWGPENKLDLDEVLKPDVPRGPRAQ